MEDLYTKKKNCLLNMKGKIYNYIKGIWYRDPPLTSEDIQKEFRISKATASEHLSDLEDSMQTILLAMKILQQFLFLKMYQKNFL